MAQLKTIFDDIDEEAEAAAVAKADAEFAAGKGIPHEIVGAWLQRLAKGERVPPPFLD